jgi:DUF4097 and DUF4098 domain-containing protein YvlB
VRVEARAGAAFDAGDAHVTIEGDGTYAVKPAAGGSKPVDVRCPPGTDVIIGTASGNVELVGPLGAVRVTTASAAVKIEEAASVDVRTASGKVDVGHCHGTCRAVTKSSRVRVRSAGALDCSVVSGSVEVGEVEHAVVRTVSGRVTLAARGGGRVEVRTVSGTVDVEVPRPHRPATTLRSISGRVRCDCEPGHDGEVSVATTSGAINVTCR